MDAKYISPLVKVFGGYVFVHILPEWRGTYKQIFALLASNNLDV